MFEVFEEYESEVRSYCRKSGIDFSAIDPAIALEISHKCFDRGLVIELAGREDSVLKILPPLTIGEDELMSGLRIIEESIKEYGI